MRRVLPVPFVAVLALLASAAGLAVAAPAPPAEAACASKTTRSISAYVYGQDGKDVNASVGFDVLDSSGRPLNTDPASASYGCPKTGAYSVPQTYLNHFVGYQGAPANSAMKDGTRTRRLVRVGSLPSNASKAFVEVYSRGYAGSPCKDSRGNWCFNPTDVRKYGYANKQNVPVGTQGLHIRLATTCGFGGKAGSIVGKATNTAGQPVTMRQVYAWTGIAWNTAPAVHGWGSHKPTGSGYALRSLASGQPYTVWAYGPNGTKQVRKGVWVHPCKSTPLNFRF